jgi:hypothetical protein
MARLEQVLVNGDSLPIGNGLEGRIASTIDRNGAGSCVAVQVRIEQRSYSFTFRAGAAKVEEAVGAERVRPRKSWSDSTRFTDPPSIAWRRTARQSGKPFWSSSRACENSKPPAVPRPRASRCSTQDEGRRS